MNAHLIATRYLEALEEADIEKTLSLFTPQASIISPLYGEKKASEFYPELFEDTSNSRLVLKGVMEGQSATNDTKLISIWFHFDWTLANGQPAPFDVVDVLELNKENGLIEKLHIVYDTFPIRSSFDQSKSR